MSALQPRHFDFFTANDMMPPLRAVGVGLQIVRVCSPTKSVEQFSMMGSKMRSSGFFSCVVRSVVRKRDD